jgi:hypothetical protein
VNVYCEICGKEWDSRDPDVFWLNIDRAWFCADEGLCFERRAMASLLEGRP